MIKKAVFGGSFDPLTYGHLDIIERALKLFESLTVVITANPTKKSVMSLEEREEMVKAALKHFGHKVAITSLQGAFLVDLAFNLSEHAVLIRALRNHPDFDYELDLARINRQRQPQVETLFVMADPKLMSVSSSTVRSLLTLEGGLEEAKTYVPGAVWSYLDRMAQRLRDCNESNTTV